MRKPKKLLATVALACLVVFFVPFAGALAADYCDDVSQSTTGKYKSNVWDVVQTIGFRPHSYGGSPLYSVTWKIYGWTPQNCTYLAVAAFDDENNIVASGVSYTVPLIQDDNDVEVLFDENTVSSEDVAKIQLVADCPSGIDFILASYDIWEGETSYYNGSEYDNEVFFTLRTGGALCSATCGNGSIEEAEGCDDSNTSNGDGCDSLCVIEEGW